MPEVDQERRSQKGLVIGGRYEVLGRLGKGGMASVYRARDQRLLREVAVKVLAANSEDEEESLFYFHREARAIAALRHHNITQIYDYSGPKERPAFIVMELIEGGNIDETILIHHPIPEPIILATGHAVASALQHAHDHGVIHRDIKPANVMVEGGGRLLLTDFGIAKAYKDAQMLGSTMAGQKTQLFGTPDFMAPEQVLERELGPHTDVFALGSLLYCMATNVSPFDHEDTVEILRRVVNGEYTPLADSRPGLSRELNLLVMACLQPSPGDRLSCGEVASICEDLVFGLRRGSPQRWVEGFLRGEELTPSTEGPPTSHSETTAPDSKPLEAGGRGDSVGEADNPMSAMPTVIAAAPALEQDTTARGKAHSRRLPTSRTVPIALGITAGATLGAVLLLVVFLITKGGVSQRPAQETPEATTNEVTPRPERVSVEAAKSESGQVPVFPSPASGKAAMDVEAAVAGPAPPASSGEEDTATTPPPESPSAPDRGESQPVAPEGRKAKAGSAGRRGNPKKRAHKIKPWPVVPSQPLVKAEPGEIVITVRPWGQVVIDGKVHGNTPLVRLVELPAGKHDISVTHPTLGTIDKTIVVKPNQRKAVVFDLRSE